ncbi:MAG TPA: hypothetical protein VH540_17615 [Ktedonobacterales bacterium]
MQTPSDQPDDNPMPAQEPLPAPGARPQHPASSLRSALQRWPLVVKIGIVAAILVAIGGWSIPKLAARFASPPPVTTVAISGTPYDCGDTYTSSSSAPIGLPAIQPHLSGVPAFTEDDVRDYVNGHPFAGRRFESKGAVTITRILFTTSYDACQLMKGSIGLSKDAIVCYVELSGTFIISPPFTATPLPPVHTGKEVFDGKTGNLLVQGVG